MTPKQHRKVAGKILQCTLNILCQSE